MGTSPLSPEDIRAAAGAHHELGPEYGDAVVASFLEKIDHEIAIRVDERLAARAPRTRTPAERENRRTLVKGFGYGVTSSLVLVLLADGARAGHHALVLLALVVVLIASGVRWAGRHLEYRRTPRQGPGVAGGDYRPTT